MPVDDPWPQRHDYVDLKVNVADSLYQHHALPERQPLSSAKITRSLMQLVLKLRRRKRWHTLPVRRRGRVRQRLRLGMCDSIVLVQTMMKSTGRNGNMITVTRTNSVDCVNRIKAHTDKSHEFVLVHCDSISLRLDLVNIVKSPHTSVWNLSFAVERPESAVYPAIQYDALRSLGDIDRQATLRWWQRCFVCQLFCKTMINPSTTFAAKGTTTCINFSKYVTPTDAHVSQTFCHLPVGRVAQVELVSSSGILRAESPHTRVHAANVNLPCELRKLC